MRLSASETGLLLFIAVQVFNFLGLTLDALLDHYRVPTISQHAREYPAFGYAILAVQFGGMLGLALHFWGRE